MQWFEGSAGFHSNAVNLRKKRKMELN